jgi:hypothetical protein
MMISSMAPYANDRTHREGECRTEPQSIGEILAILLADRLFGTGAGHGARAAFTNAPSRLAFDCWPSEVEAERGPSP